MSALDKPAAAIDVPINPPLGRRVLDLQSVTKRFGQVIAVNNVSISVVENEFFALLGPSGCGKTTLLRMLAGFETPSEGHILLDGRDIGRMRPEHRPVNLMFQSYALFPHMTVAKNIAYGLESEHLSRAEVRRRVAEILDVTHLADFANRRPEQLSGGQRQRVALARALVKRPRVLLLDEPLAALDKKLREQMQLELKRLQHEVGITFIIVTHDQEEALVMSDRIAVMKGGEVQQCDGPHNVYEFPSNRFVADFIGKMNFIEGIASAGVLTLADGSSLPTPPGASLSGAAVLAIRPERLRLSPRVQDSAPPAAAAVPATVTELAYHGMDLAVHLECPVTESAVQVRLTAARADASPVRPGDSVWVEWTPAEARLLPA